LVDLHGFYLASGARVAFAHSGRRGRLAPEWGALGFGVSATFDSNGHITNWFAGLDIDAHIAVIFGFEADYKLGFAK
jgi:hypothetical protein